MSNNLMKKLVKRNVRKQQRRRVTPRADSDWSLPTGQSTVEKHMDNASECSEAD